MIEAALHSARITLQLISYSDMEFIHELLSHEEIDRFNALGIPSSVEKTISIVAA